MGKVISLPDDVYARLEALARPFVDKEPADVVRRLVEGALRDGENRHGVTPSPHRPETPVVRASRVRGATIDLDGTTVQADTVPDLSAKVMDYLFAHGHGGKVLSLCPYKTSTERYLYSKTPKHPNGKSFFNPVLCHGLHVEAHKDYRAAIKQLAVFAGKCGVRLIYVG